MELKEVLSEDYINGLKAGLQVAKDIARKQGYEIEFPDIDEMSIERDEKPLKHPKSTTPSTPTKSKTKSIR